MNNCSVILLENSLPISGRDFEVKILVKYIAVCLGLTRYLDLREESISFLLILKNLQTVVCIKSIETLFSVKFNKSFKITFVSDKFGILLYILEKEIIRLIAPTISLILVVISELIKSSISLERLICSE